MFLNRLQKIFLLCITLVILTSCGIKYHTSESKPPNVILIVVDDLGYKDLAFMGSEYYETPNLDALAKEGMTFMNAYASAANCAPSRACMISGQQSPRHGVYTVSPSARGNARTRKIIPIQNTKHLTNDLFTLADMFKSAGYITGSFGKWHIGENPSLQGIDVNVGGSGKGNPGRQGYFSPYKIDNIENGPNGEYLTDRLTNEAITFISQNKDQPFFLYLPYYTVHTPIMAKDKLLAKFQNKPGVLGQSNAEYAAMIYSMDENIGSLLAHLKKQEVDKNTLVIFTSDNGGISAISSQKPFRAGKGSYYEGGIRVPMVVRWPDEVKPGTRCETRVTNMDFYPTLKKIIKSSRAPLVLDGIDISPLFQGRAIPERDLFWHFPIYLQAYDMKLDDGRDPLFRTRPGSVLISEDWKLHEYFEDGSLELYDLSRDIGERKNLVLEERAKALKMHQKMKDMRRELDAPVPAVKNTHYDVDFERKELQKVK